MLTCDKILKRGLAAADWNLHNQVPHSGDAFVYNSNQGRFTYELWDDGYLRYHASWGSAVSLMTLLLAKDLTGSTKYDNAIRWGLNYLKSLQIMDPRDEECFGAIREYNSTSSWIFPRDATTVAWLFLHMFDRTGDEEYLYRANIYGQWFCNNALDEDGWSRGRIIIDPTSPEEVCAGDQDYQLKLQCQMGNLPFLAWLYQETQNEFYRDTAGGIFDMILTRFQRDDGTYFAENKRGHHSGLRPGNDDFAGVGVIACEQTLGFTGGIESAKRYADSLIKDQQTHEHPSHMSALPSAINLYCILDDIAGEDHYRPWALQAAEYLFKRCTSNTLTETDMPFDRPEDSWRPWDVPIPFHYCHHDQASTEEKLKGGFYTMKRYSEQAGKTIYATCGRTNSYASMAFIRLAGTNHNFFSPYVGKRSLAVQAFHG